MSDANLPQAEAPAPSDAFVAILVAAVASVMLLIGSLSNLGSF